MSLTAILKPVGTQVLEEKTDPAGGAAGGVSKLLPQLRQFCTVRPWLAMDCKGLSNHGLFINELSTIARNGNYSHFAIENCHLYWIYPLKIVILRIKPWLPKG